MVCFVQAQTELFEITPREGRTRKLVKNATVYIVSPISLDSLLLSEYTSGKAGTYYRAAVPFDKYKVYVNGTKIKEKHPFGTRTTVADTVQLKRADTTYGPLVLLQLASGTNGGGTFIEVDSTYAEDGGTAFGSATAGEQWGRQTYIETGKKHSSDYATLALAFSNLINGDNLIINQSSTATGVDSIKVDSVSIDIQKGVVLNNRIVIAGDTTGVTPRTYLTVNAEEGDDSLVVNSVSGFSAGDWVFMLDSNWVDAYGANRDPGNQIDINKIRSIEGDTLVLYYPIMFDFLANADSCWIQKATIRNNIKINGGTWEGTWDIGGAASDCFYVNFAYDITLNGVSIYKYQRGVFSEDTRELSLVKKSKVNYCQYGFISYRGLDADVSDSRFISCDLAMISFLNGSKSPRANKNELEHLPMGSEAGATGIQTQYADDPIITTNDIYGKFQKVNYGISINHFSPGGIISGNTIVGARQAGIIGARVKYLNIVNNNIRDMYTGSGIALETSIGSVVSNNIINNMATGIGIKIQCNPGYFNIISNNIINDMGHNGILLEHDNLAEVGTDTLKGIGFVGYKNKIIGNIIHDTWRAITLEDSVYNTYIMGNAIDTTGQTNSFSSFVGSAGDTAIVGDGFFLSEEYDLSGAGDTSVVFIADSDIHLIGVATYYTENTSADIGTRYTVGRRNSAGTFDVDFYFADTTLASVSAGKTKVFHTSDTSGSGDVILSPTKMIKTGTAIYLTCEGAKTGAGKMILKVKYMIL